MSLRFTGSFHNLYYIVLTNLILLDFVAPAPMGIVYESSPRLLEPRHNSGVIRSFAPRALAGRRLIIKYMEWHRSHCRYNRAGHCYHRYLGDMARLAKTKGNEEENE